MNRFFDSIGFSRFTLFFFYVTVAAASFSGFYTKWRLNDGHPVLGLASMVEGTAARPYVYRQFLPDLVNGIQALLPQKTVQIISARLADPSRVNSRHALAMKFPASESLQPAITLRYYLVYYLTFSAFVASLFVMRRLCLQLGATPASAMAAPLILALILPFLLTGGGYFYDFLELLFFMSAVLISSRQNTRLWQRVTMLLIISTLGTWNKEAFFWFTPTLYPLLRQHLTRKNTIVLIASLLLVCGCIYLALRVRYAANIGDTVNFQLWRTLRFYVNPENWFLTESTYGIPLPRGFSIVPILIIANIVRHGWKKLPGPFQQHALIALAINLPLFLLFCSPGEMRNLSLLYPTLLAVITTSLTTWLTATQLPSAHEPHTRLMPKA